MWATSRPSANKLQDVSVLFKAKELKQDDVPSPKVPDRNVTCHDDRVPRKYLPYNHDREAKALAISGSKLINEPSADATAVTGIFPRRGLDRCHQPGCATQVTKSAEPESLP